MFTDPFYHQTLKKTVIAFGSLFNNIYIVRTQDNNQIKIKVPIVYTSNEKFIQRYRDTLNRENKDSVVLQTILPRIGFEMGEITYDASRKKPSVNKRIVELNNNYKINYTEVPYNVNFNLSVYVRYIDDGLQIAEQILPYFTPDFTVAIKQQVLGEPGERMNIPFILNSVSQEIDSEGSIEATGTRMIVWNYGFTARIHLFGPLLPEPTIKLTEINFRDFEELGEQI